MHIGEHSLDHQKKRLGSMMRQAFPVGGIEYFEAQLAALDGIDNASEVAAETPRSFRLFNRWRGN